MKTQFLLPNSLKLPGIIMMLLAIVISVVAKYTELPLVSGNINVFAVYSSGIFENGKFFQTISANILFTFFNFVFITGAMMAAFSRLKNEDEYISKLRLESLVWAVYANFIIILLANFAIYGTDFMDVLIINMYTIPVLFLLRFNYLVYKTNKLAQNEK
jgi:hypothetical protein